MVSTDDKKIIYFFLSLIFFRAVLNTNGNREYEYLNPCTFLWLVLLFSGSSWRHFFSWCCDIVNGSPAVMNRPVGAKQIVWLKTPSICATERFLYQRLFLSFHSPLKESPLWLSWLERFYAFWSTAIMAVNSKMIRTIFFWQ